MRLPRFDYLKPDTLEQALDLLATHKGDAKILAGGTDLLVRMKKGLLAPKTLISLKGLDELAYIRPETKDGKIFLLIGAKPLWPISLLPVWFKGKPLPFVQPVNK